VFLCSILILESSLSLVEFRQMRPGVGGIRRKLDCLFLEGSRLFKVTKRPPRSGSALSYIKP
jgi:hypothetical protein